MVLKYEKQAPTDSLSGLKYSILNYYKPLSDQEKGFVLKLFSDVMGIERKTFYRWMNIPLYNEDGTPHKFEIPLTALVIFARLFNLNSPNELLNYTIDIKPLPRYDQSFTRSLMKSHSIKLPDKRELHLTT
jgi:hypothetical protein